MDTFDQFSTWRGKVGDYFSLERNVSIAAGAVFILGLGEELWKKFVPKYLEALGAGAPIVGLYGTTQDFFDAIYQYPGGWLADRVDRRRAFLFFVTLAAAGYLVFLLSPSWPFLFLGLALVMAWQSMASPAIFAVIGDSLPRERRAMGFTMQSILKRVPIVIAPVIGGGLIASLGVIKGIHVALLITFLLALVTMILVSRISVTVGSLHAIGIVGVWRTFHTGLKRLLVSDVIIRMCEGMSGVRSGSVVLHELYFANLGGDPKPGGKALEVIKQWFGSYEQWEDEFKRTANALGGGSGWAVFAQNAHTGEFHNYWSWDHIHNVPMGQPLLVLDMYEHAYHMDYGAAAAKYVDAFLQNVNWEEVNRRVEALSRG